jgi:hypothetical protein
MRTRAVAVGGERSNAIGAVELECTPLGLVIFYQGVGSFQEGYAPGAVTAGTRVLVPWADVREASLSADRLFLHVDEALTPHHRLLLAAFSTGDPPLPGQIRRQRLLVRLGTGAAMLVGGLLVAITVVRASSEGGAGAAVMLGCLAAAVVFVLGMVADRRLGTGGVESEGVRLAFATELAAYVPGLALALRPEGPRRLAPVPPQLPSFQLLLPRSTTAVVITMSAAVLGAVLTASWLARAPARSATGEPTEAVDRTATDRREPPSRPPAASEPASAPVAVAPGPAPPGSQPSPTEATPVGPEKDLATLSGACSCRRADSLLWRDGLPRMSTILIERRAKTHNGHEHLDVEIGVSNNWDHPLSQVALVVQFFEKDPPPSSKRTPTFDRPLYFEGPLAPGQAIMWHVEARGNDFEVTGPPDRMLDELGADAAPTNLLADLLKAIHRPVRLHGAMMLAYLGDPRAKEGALGLREALREDEAPYIDRLAWTLSDVRTCRVDVTGSGGSRTVRACVYNAATEPRERLALRVRALDRPFRHDTPVEPPPIVVAEHVWKLAGRLAPGQGALASVALDTANPDGLAPVAFEAYADREEVVF